MDNNKPVRPNKPSNGTAPVRPNMQGNARPNTPVRPNMQVNNRPNMTGNAVRPANLNGASIQNINKTNGQAIAKPVRPAAQPNNRIITQKVVEEQPIINDNMELDDFTTVIDNNNEAVDTVTPVENKKKPKREKVKKEKKVKEPKINTDNQVNVEGIANKKSGKSKVKIIIPVVIVIVLVVAGCIIASTFLKSNQQHITLADKPPVEMAEENTESVELVVSADKETQSDITTDTIKLNTETPYIQTPSDDVISVGDDIVIPMTINTKLEGDSQYTDYYTYVTFKLNELVCGYDNVITSIQEYNQISNSIISLGTKEEFYKANTTSDIVMYEAELSVPSDFPTQDTKNYKTFIDSDLNMSLYTTSEDGESIVTELYVFAVPQLTDISLRKSDLIAGETYKFKWIALMPNGLSGETYRLVLEYTDKNTTVQYNYNGIDIPGEMAEGLEVTGAEAQEETLDTLEEGTVEEETVEEETVEEETEAQ